MGFRLPGLRMPACCIFICIAHLLPGRSLAEMLMVDGHHGLCSIWALGRICMSKARAGPGALPAALG